jgi:hypothetical protein
MSIFPPFPEIQHKIAMWNHNLPTADKSCYPQTACANRSELHKHFAEGLNVVKKLKCSTALSLYIKGVLHDESIIILGHGNKLHELTPATPNNELLCLQL